MAHNVRNLSWNPIYYMFYQLYTNFLVIPVTVHWCQLMSMSCMCFLCKLLDDFSFGILHSNPMVSSTLYICLLGTNVNKCEKFTNAYKLSIWILHVHALCKFFQDPHKLFKKENYGKKNLHKKSFLYLFESSKYFSMKCFQSETARMASRFQQKTVWFCTT